MDEIPENEAAEAGLRPATRPDKKDPRNGENMPHDDRRRAMSEILKRITILSYLQLANALPTQTWTVTPGGKVSFLPLPLSPTGLLEIVAISAENTLLQGCWCNGNGHLWDQLAVLKNALDSVKNSQKISRKKSCMRALEPGAIPRWGRGPPRLLLRAPAPPARPAAPPRARVAGARPAGWMRCPGDRLPYTLAREWGGGSLASFFSYASSSSLLFLLGELAGCGRRARPAGAGCDSGPGRDPDRPRRPTWLAGPGIG